MRHECEKMQKKITTVLIDETGDPGSSEHASKYFVMVATITDHSNKMKMIATRLRRSGVELKYHDSSHEIRRTILKEMSNVDSRFVAVYVDKEDIIPGTEGRTTYQDVAKELLNEVASLVEGDVRIIFDENNNLRRGKASSMVSEAMMLSRGNLIKIEVIRSNICLAMQVHDFITGSVGTKLNEKNDCYFLIIKKQFIVKRYKPKYQK